MVGFIALLKRLYWIWFGFEAEHYNEGEKQEFVNIILSSPSINNPK